MSIHLAMFESKSFAQSTILSEVHASWCPNCDRLQHSHTPHKIGPVLFFPHMSPAAVPQPSNALWRGFELTRGVNSTKFVSVCCCVVCGFGCHVCLQRTLACLCCTHHLFNVLYQAWRLCAHITQIQEQDQRGHRSALGQLWRLMVFCTAESC